MMADGLAQARERGCALSILIASEGEIYERYGYGVATEHCTWTLDTHAARFREDYTAGFEFELCVDADLADEAPEVYATAAAGMPGAMSRDEYVWQQYLGMSGLSYEDASKARHAVRVLRGGEPVGYARYTVKESSEQPVDTSVLKLHDLCAETPEASAALWQFLASLDLVSTISAGDRAPHEPLPWLLHDRRAARLTDLADFQWVAVLDPLAALRGREYAAAGRCVLEVVDHGRYSIESDASGSAVEPTSSDPDATLPAQHSGLRTGSGGALPAARRRPLDRPPTRSRLGAISRAAAVSGPSHLVWPCPDRRSPTRRPGDRSGWSTLVLRLSSKDCDDSYIRS